MLATLRASSAHRYLRCPGSRKASEGIPPAPAGDAADSGHRVHGAVARLITENTMPSGLSTREEYVSRWMAGIVLQEESKRGGVQMALHEQDVQVTGKNGVIWSGHMDRITICNDGSRLLWEYKSGYLPVDAADSNVQGRIYVAAADAHPMVDGEGPITLFILQAGAEEGERVTCCDYDDAAVIAARAEAAAIHQRTYDCENERCPGEHCRYCPASATPRCPESTERMAVVVKTWTDELLADPVRLAVAMQTWKQLKVVGDKIEAGVRMALEAGTKVPGYDLKPGSVRREVEDINAAWEIMAASLPPERFISACSLSIPSLVDAVHANQPKVDGQKPASKAAVAKSVEAMLEPVIVRKEQRARIVEVKAE